ncbi:hypothetical protein LINGRAHAP2_LOCUS3524 [Linum grandiflorum]
MFDIVHMNRTMTFRFAIYPINPVPPGLTALCLSVENLELSLFGNLQALGANNFPALETLRLHNCVLRPIHAGFGNARTLYDVLFGGFPNLNKLEIIGCDYMTNLPIHISGGDKLVDLVSSDGMGEP